jgi:hypothetical protein
VNEGLIINDPGLAQLDACVRRLFGEALDELKRGADLTRPLTAEGLCARWNIAGDSDEARLVNLARKCRLWGLEPMKGTRGWEALYARSKVLAAEAYAAGTSKRRRAA